MKIYIVQEEYYGYECSSSYNMKAFTKKENAEAFKKDLELRNQILRDELKKISIESEIERDRINSMNLEKKEYVKKLIENGKIYREKQERLIKESNLDWYILDAEKGGFEIEELELDEG